MQAPIPPLTPTSALHADPIGVADPVLPPSVDETTGDTPASLRDRLAALIGDQRIVMLTTQLPDGQLESRPMTVLEHDAAGRFWFFCADDRTDASPHRLTGPVNLAFSDEAHSTYVSIAGRAELLHDRSRIEALWTPMARPWFPDGPASPDLALLKVTPEHIGWWDAPDSRVVRALAMAASVAAGRPIGLGDHGELTPALTVPAR